MKIFVNYRLEFGNLKFLVIISKFLERAQYIDFVFPLKNLTIMNFSISFLLVLNIQNSPLLVQMD